MNLGVSAAPDAGRDQGQILPLEQPEAVWHGRHLGFIPVRLTLDFWCPELWENTSLLL